MPPQHIAILEDNDGRTNEMKSVLKETHPDIPYTIKYNADDFISWLTGNIERVSLICLDHDLDPGPASDPRRDMGDGRQVVRWLIGQSTLVPVLIHTSNGIFGAQMETLLKEAGWKVYWTPPYEDLAWIRRSWIRRVGEMMLPG